MIKSLLPSMREEAFFDLLSKVTRRLCTVSQTAASDPDRAMYMTNVHHIH